MRLAEPDEAGKVLWAAPEPLPSNTNAHPSESVRARLDGVGFTPHGR
ncbi:MULTISPECIES: hypothetical protein [unclassified Nocardiopsis]|nr:hypothetical protein [Nocardiopsis sp. TSRI0078]